MPNKATNSERFPLPNPPQIRRLWLALVNRAAAMKFLDFSLGAAALSMASLLAGALFLTEARADEQGSSVFQLITNGQRNIAERKIADENRNELKDSIQDALQSEVIAALHIAYEELKAGGVELADVTPEVERVNYNSSLAGAGKSFRVEKSLDSGMFMVVSKYRHPIPAFALLETGVIAADGRLRSGPIIDSNGAISRQCKYDVRLAQDLDLMDWSKDVGGWPCQEFIRGEKRQELVKLIIDYVAERTQALSNSRH